MSGSHRVKLVDRLDPSRDVDNGSGSGGLYFTPRDSQSSTQLLDSAAAEPQLRGAGFVWNSLTPADIMTDSSEHVRTGSDRSPAAGAAFSASSGLSPSTLHSLSEVSGQGPAAVDDRSDGASSIVAERNFAGVAQLMNRQQRPAPSSSLLAHHLTTSTPRCVPVANVHPIMKDAAKTHQSSAPVVTTPAIGGSTLGASSTLQPPPQNDIPAGAFRRLPIAPVTDDDSACPSQLTAAASTMSVSSGHPPLEPRPFEPRPLEPRPPPAKDVRPALMAPGLTRGGGGRVSSHQTEYVKFLSKKSDADSASVAASLSVSGGATAGHSRSVRAQQTVDKRRGGGGGGSNRGSISAKARRQLHFYHHDAGDLSVPLSVPDKTTAVTCHSESSAANSLRLNPVTAVCSASDDHAPRSSSSCVTLHSTCNSCVTSSASAIGVSRKTTPIVYFDDDESTTETQSSSGSQRHGHFTAVGKLSAGKSSKKIAARATGWNTAGTGKRPPGGTTVKRRKHIITAVTKNERSNGDQAAAAAAAADDDDDLTDFEDAQPFTSAQVGFLHLKLCCQG